MKKIVLILLTALFCLTSKVDAQPRTDETLRVPKNSFSSLVRANSNPNLGRVELGDFMAMTVDGPLAKIELGNYAWSRKLNRFINEPECSARNTSRYWWTKGSTPIKPNGPPTGVVKGLGKYEIRKPGSGAWILYVEMAYGTCLRTVVDVNNPLPRNQEWWIRHDNGFITDMAIGGGSPQCKGSCLWFSRVVR